ncbi:hypothetical protein [Spirosoma validum]|uniref:Uncharacterized protein n=1 Tax=Spirosoma validum TaxID=2771355 RepID=A0A927AXA2_9BACT|nr:hypothetical protein [Spirosoma validum]MBD2751455.1 hypothetical protein [Spirosoma validum]
MKNCLTFLLLSSLALACKTDIISKIDEPALEHGGYVRTVTPYPVTTTTFNVSKANMGGTKMEFLAEAVTQDKGALFASYDLTIRFVDATPANGTKTTAYVALKSLAASSFTKDPTTGYPRSTIAVTGTEAMTATKLVDADISNGDRFEISGTMKLTNGRSFSAANTYADVTSGPFFTTPFLYRLNVVN